MFERIKQRAKLIRPLLIPFIFYIGLLAFSIKWLEENPESSWRIVVALLPLIPGILIALGIVHAITQLDELERRILLEGIAFSFAMTFILVLSYGLLDLAGVTILNGSYIALFMAIFMLIGKLWGNRRYR
jgi:uncharacterized membrane protein